MTDIVTLHTGETVSSYSAEWLHECEAMSLLKMPGKAARLDYLFGAPDPKTGTRRGGIAKRRGMDAANRLQGTAMAIWESRK